MRTISQFILLVLLSLSFVACGPETQPDPDPDASRAAIATEVVATITAEAAQALAADQSSATQPTVQGQVPTYTPTPTPMPSLVPTDTPVPTNTPLPTDTPKPRPTPTPLPGIGDRVDCEDMWRLGATQPPDFSGVITDDPPKGAYAQVFFLITNLQSQTDELFADELWLIGEIDGRQLAFEPTYLDTSIRLKEQGIASWMDDFPPLVEVPAVAIFDVNPNAVNWQLRLDMDRYSSGDCQTQIALYDTKPERTVDQISSNGSSEETETGSTAPQGLIATINSASINLRSGPGTGFNIAGQATQGQRMTVVGRNEAGDWYEVCCVGGKNVWVASFLADLSGDASAVVVSQNIPATPTPAPTPIPAATPTPLSYASGIGAAEVQVQNWGLKLYAVKKAKTVYWYGEGEYAAGVWLIPLVEFRNLGSGTDKPNASLDFYLQDSLGRTFEYDIWTDGDLGASWQFQAGRLYDKINPGSVLGIAIPFDVAPDLGDMWLRVEQNPAIAIYLGNVSQLPQEN